MLEVESTGHCGHMATRNPGLARLYISPRLRQLILILHRKCQGRNHMGISMQADHSNALTYFILNFYSGIN